MNRSILPITLLVFVYGCADFGKGPTEKDHRRLSKSPQFNLKTGRFFNKRWKEVEEAREKISFFKILKAKIFGKEVRFPTVPLPTKKPNIIEFIKKSEKIKYIWLGHSSFLLNMEGKIILFDPVFSQNAAPVSFLVNRFSSPVIQLNELPNIDYIVISHDHYDHLDMKTIKYFRDKETKFYVPLGVGSHLVHWGISKNKISEMDWWEEHSPTSSLVFACLPSFHFSGRSGLAGNNTLWASWALLGKHSKIYFSGDTGSDSHFKAIGNKYGPFDLSFIENGQYSSNWPLSHLMPKQSVQASIDLKSRYMQPVHWGMFDLSLHNWFDPVEYSTNEAKIQGVKILTPHIGELVTLKKNLNYPKWWRTTKDFKKTNNIQ